MLPLNDFPARKVYIGKHKRRLCLLLGCESGSVGRAHDYQSDGHGFESWLRRI